MSTLVTELTPEYNFSAAPAIPRYCTSLLNRACDFLWERKLNIRTTGGAPSPHPDARHYGCLAYDTYFRIFDRLQLNANDVVVDLGCGKGRVVCVAATYPVKEVVGVEIDPDLHKLGEVNGSIMRGRRAPLRFVCQSATEFNYDSATTVVLISPFGEQTMDKTLDRIEQSLEANPREFKIAYGNPVLSPMLASRKLLKLYECWKPGKWSRIKFPVHFYRSVYAFFVSLVKKCQEMIEVAAETMHYCPI
jgi:predicted RNA methylase